MIEKTQVSDKSMNHVTTARGKYKVHMFRYAEGHQFASDFVICQNYYNKNNSTKWQQDDSVNAQRLQDMFYPLMNKHTGEARCVENPVEYHKLQ